MQQWAAMAPARLLPPVMAADAAARAGVTTRELISLGELALVDGLFAAIWGSTGPQVAMPVNLLQAIRHSGGYVAGAWRGAELVAAGVGFLGRHGGEMELHSHVAGVARSEQGRGVGLALKLHQREWAASCGIGAVTWTFDPLNRGNGWFNLGVLGATAVQYFPYFYGQMVDDLNGTDETDRCLARWSTAGPFSSPGEPEAAWSAPALLEVGPDGGPVPAGGSAMAAGAAGAGGAGGAAAAAVGGGAAGAADPVGGEGPVTCQVPPDAVALRRSDPARARAWRLALREAMGTAMAAGRVATGITRDGRYLLEVPEASEVPAR